MSKRTFEKSFMAVRRGKLAGPVCGLLFALAAAMAGAADVAPAPAQRGAEARWLSGGVGDEALDAMRQAAAAYNVHITFSTRDGAYLADIPFTVTRQGGDTVYFGVSEGPLLYLRLEPGSYRITAELDGVRQTRDVRIDQGVARLTFVSASTARN